MSSNDIVHEITSLINIHVDTTKLLVSYVIYNKIDQ